MQLPAQKSPIKDLVYATSNLQKLSQARAVCEPLGINLQQIKLDISEIQAEDGEPIARDKAANAFALLQKPVVVSDDNWLIPGLNNFPGPYMKSMNAWFSPQRWLALTNGLTDRTIILRQIVMYQDAPRQQMFSVDIPGILLHEIRGLSPCAHCTITSLDGGKTSMAEYHQLGESAPTLHHSAWQDFATWYTEEAA